MSEQKRKWKTDDEKRQENIKYKITHHTEFLVLFVKDKKLEDGTFIKTEERMRKDGTGTFPAAVGSYKLYFPEQDKVGWIQKFMLKKPTEEKVVGQIITWNDWNTKYGDPETVEWKDDQYENNRNAEMYDEAKAHPTLEVRNSQPKKDFFSDYNEKELFYLLEKNGWDNESVLDDLSLTLDKYPETDTRTRLLILCRERNVKPPSVESPKTEGVLPLKLNHLTEFMDTLDGVLSNMNTKIDKLETKIDELTIGGVLSLKDLLSKSKLEKLLPESEE